MATVLEVYWEAAFGCLLDLIFSLCVSGYTYGCVGLFQELEGLWRNYALLHFSENSSANIISYYGI